MRIKMPFIVPVILVVFFIFILFSFRSSVQLWQARRGMERARVKIACDSMERADSLMWAIRAAREEKQIEYEYNKKQSELDILKGDAEISRIRKINDIIKECPYYLEYLRAKNEREVVIPGGVGGNIKN